MRRLFLLSLACLAAGSFGAEAGAAPSCAGAGASAASRGACEKDWTVLVYMAADNDLFPYALWNLYEMEATRPDGRDTPGSTENADLVVQVDGPASDDLRRLHIEASPEPYGRRSLEDFRSATLDSVRSPVVGRPPENDGADESSRLADFLSWAARAYPSKHYLVVVWGHGEGWRASASAPYGGIAYKQSTRSWLTTPGLASALASFRALTGRAADIYASDACLMQSLEVARELGDSARFVVGSAGIENLLGGLPYRRLMLEINKLSSSARPAGDSAAELVARLPVVAKSTLGIRGFGLREGPRHGAVLFMSSSALSASALEAGLVPAMSRLSSALSAYLREDRRRAARLRYAALAIPSLPGASQDLGLFLSMIESLLREEAASGALTPAAAALREELPLTRSAALSALPAFRTGLRYGVPDDAAPVPAADALAVSVWLPLSRRDYTAREADLSSSRFFRETRWAAWLAELLATN